MNAAQHAALVACATVAMTNASDAAVAPQPIAYTLTVPIATHDFDKNLSGPPAGYPIVHVEVTCAVGAKLRYSRTGLSGDIVARGTNFGTSTGTLTADVPVTVIVAPRSYARFVELAKPMYACFFIAGPIRDATDVVVTPRNATGSVMGPLPIPPTHTSH